MKSLERIVPFLLLGAAAWLLIVGLSGEGELSGLEDPRSINAGLDLPYSPNANGESEEEAPEVLIFYGQAFEADGFFYCLDGSLSMADGEWQTLRGEVTRSIRELSEGIEFGIVFFDEDTWTFPANKKPARASAKTKAQCDGAVASVEPGSWTCMLEGLKEALEQARAAKAKRRSIIFMSDGKPTCPGTDFVTYRERIFDEVRVLNTEKISIHTLGIGLDVDESFLRKLALENGGTYRRLAR